MRNIHVTITNKDELIALYKKDMIDDNLSEKSIYSYQYVVEKFFRQYDRLEKLQLIEWRERLISTNKPSTVKQRITAMNRFLKYIKRYDLTLKQISVQKTFFLESMITLSEYQKMLDELDLYIHEKGDRCGSKRTLYILIKILATTGCRISEALQMRVRDIIDKDRGYADIYNKGKVRRIFIPLATQKALMPFLECREPLEKVFLSQYKESLSVKACEANMKYYAEKFFKPSIAKKWHPHALRHFFSIHFLKKRPNDLALLSDLLGHSNINTTRQYLTLTFCEQARIISATVTW